MQLHIFAFSVPFPIFLAALIDRILRKDHDCFFNSSQYLAKQQLVENVMGASGWRQEPCLTLLFSILHLMSQKRNCFKATLEHLHFDRTHRPPLFTDSVLSVIKSRCCHQLRGCFPRVHFKVIYWNFECIIPKQFLQFPLLPGWTSRVGSLTLTILLINSNNVKLSPNGFLFNLMFGA